MIAEMTRRGTLGGLAAAMLAPQARAQRTGWPNRTIRFISPFAPGGPQEVPARFIAEHLTQRLGQPVVIETRPGAGSALGTQYVVRETDGHTFLFTTTSLATLPALQKDPGFDPFTDLVPISLVSESPLALVTQANSSLPDLAGLLAQARARPGQVSFGSSGIGASTHLAGALLQVKAGIELLHVPFRGVGPSLNALLAGDIQMMIGDISIPLPHIREGKLRALAVTTPERSPLLPEVPAVAEQVPGYAMPFWFALLGPKGTPPEVVQTLLREIAPLRAPDSVLAQRMAGNGGKLLLTGPDALAERLRQEVPQWKQVAAAAGIQPE